MVKAMPMKISKYYACLLSAVLVVGSMACSSDKSPTQPDEEPAAPVEIVTENFRGDLPQQTEVCHFFILTANGDIRATITDLQPLISLTVGLSIGFPAEIDPSICSDLGEDRSARVNDTFLSANNLAGPYCVCIFDVGNIFPGETVTYAIEVEHP